METLKSTSCKDRMLHHSGNRKLDLMRPRSYRSFYTSEAQEILDMDKHTLTTKSQASRTSLLPIFIYLICLQPFRTSHCYLISNTHSTFTCLICPQLLHTSHCITFLDKHNVATLITSKPPLFYLCLLSGSKTCNSKVDICYPDSTKVYGCIKINTVLLDPIINYN